MAVARRLFGPRSTAKDDAAAFGLLLEDEEEDEGWQVWPENWPAFQVMTAMRTQWRVGFAGPTGLDYGVLPSVMALVGVAEEDRPDTFQAVQVMEAEALRIFRDQQKAKG
jgi:hypothetical protein